MVVGRIAWSARKRPLVVGCVSDTNAIFFSGRMRMFSSAKTCLRTPDVRRRSEKRAVSKTTAPCRKTPANCCMMLALHAFCGPRQGRLPRIVRARMTGIRLNFQKDRRTALHGIDEGRRPPLACGLPTCVGVSVLPTERGSLLPRQGCVEHDVRIVVMSPQELRCRSSFTQNSKRVETVV